MPSYSVLTVGGLDQRGVNMLEAPAHGRCNPSNGMINELPSDIIQADSDP
jgi:hypothetical protein